MTDEPPRLLARASERGYVSYRSAAMPREPEAVDPTVIDALNERDRQAALQARRAELQRERTYHESQIRYLERQLRRLDYRINKPR